MESQVFSAAMYSLCTQDLLPPDDDDADDPDASWMDYCAEAAKLDRTDILQVVLSDLDAEDSPLFELIDSALDTPHETGRARESIVVLAKVGQAILNLVAKAVDDQVNLRMATGGRVA